MRPLNPQPGPRVSVVIPTARGGSYLREAVGSVLGQSFGDFELILVVDGSDVDVSHVEDLDGRIRSIRQPNRGESVARNVGIRAARSDLVAFLDDDDRMLPERLAAQIAAMDRDAGAGLCHTQFQVIDATGQPCQPGFSADVQYLDLLRRNVRVLLPTVMLRKSLIEEVGTFDSCLRTGQDLEAIYRLARESRLVFIPEVHTQYRRHGANASGDEYRAACNSLALIGKHLRLADGQEGAPTRQAALEGLRASRRLGASAAIGAAGRAWRHRDLIGATRRLVDAFAMSPSYTFRDLVSNRPVIGAVVSKFCRPGAGRYRVSIEKSDTTGQ